MSPRKCVPLARFFSSPPCTPWEKAICKDGQTSQGIVSISVAAQSCSVSTAPTKKEAGRHNACSRGSCSTYQELQDESLLDVIVAVNGWRQALGQQLQHVVSFRNLSDVLDVGWCHLHTARVVTTSQQLLVIVCRSTCSSAATGKHAIGRYLQYTCVRNGLILFSPPNVFAQYSNIVGDD